MILRALPELAFMKLKKHRPLGECLTDSVIFECPHSSQSKLKLPSMQHLKHLPHIAFLLADKIEENCLGQGLQDTPK